MKKDTPGGKIPAIPLIADSLSNSVGYRDTLDRVAAVLPLLSEMSLSEGLSPGAETGRYWVQLMLIDSVRYVSDALEKQQMIETRNGDRFIFLNLIKKINLNSGGSILIVHASLLYPK